jgi:tetratricopeptide (TPR) repeat protein
VSPVSPREEAGLPRGSAEVDWADVAAMATEAAETADAETAQALLYVAARIAEDSQNDALTAFELLEAALALGEGGARPLALRAERELTLQAGTVLVALRTLDQELGAATSREQRADLLVVKASLFADALALVEPARVALDEALLLVPGHAAALLAGRALAERHGDAEGMRVALERTLAAAATPALRARALARLGRLAEGEANQLSAALGNYVRVLEEDGTGDASAVARSGLRRVAVRTGQDAECLRGLMAEADSLPAGTARAAWLTTAAAVSRHRLGTPERAAATVELALLDEPADVLLSTAATEDSLNAGRWRRAVELLDRRSELLGDLDYVAVLQGEAAHVAEQYLADDEGAGRRLRRVLAAMPSDPVALQAMERIASRGGDVALQIELMSAAVGRAEDPGERAALAVRVAEMSELDRADLDAAVAFARRALDAVPGYGPAVHMLATLYARLERWNELLGVIDLEVSGPAASGGANAETTVGSAEEIAARRLERMGGVYESSLADPGKAIEIYRQWVDTGIRRTSALMAMLRAAEHAGDSLVAAEAAMRIGTELAELPPTQRVAWRYRAANLYEERAAADNEAIAAFDSVLELAPRFRPAFAGLARAHRRMGNWKELADVLSRRAVCEASVSRGASLEVEAARIHSERLQSPEGALDALGRALALEPGNLAALDLRWRFLERLGRFEEAATALGDLCERVSDPNARAALWRRQAELLEWRLRRPREALVAIERALAVGRHPGVACTELSQERLFDLVGRHGESAALQLARLGPVGARTSQGAHGSSGRWLDLAFRLPDQKEALRLVEQMAESSPGDLFVLEVSVFLAHRLDDNVIAASALERIGLASKDDGERVAAWRTALGAHVRLGGDAGAGYELLQKIAAIEPSSDAVATLERLATRRGDWPRVLSARQALVNRASEPRGRALRSWELALARLQVGDAPGALGDLESAEILWPKFAPVRFMRARLCDVAGSGRAAADAYVEFAKVSGSPARAVGALRLAWRLYAEVLRDYPAAARTLEQLLLIDPDADADFAALETLLRQRGEVQRLVAIARRRASAGKANLRRDRLFHLAALLHEQRPGDAVEPLLAAVALDPGFVPALNALGNLFAELGRAAEAVTAFRRVVTAASDSVTVAAAWSQVAKIAVEKLGDVNLAVAAYRTACVAIPDDPAILSGLIDALLRQRQYVQAAESLRRLATVEQDPSALRGHWVRLGEILAGPARDPEGAAQALEHALEIEPSHGGVLERLDVILTELGDPARRVRALTRHLDAVPDAVAPRLRLARLLREPMGQFDRAAEHLRVIVPPGGGDLALRSELAVTLEEAGRLQEAVTEHLGILAAMPLTPDSLRALRRLYAERADLEGHVGDRARGEVVAAILTALDLATPEDKRGQRDARLRADEVPPAPVGEAAFEGMVRHPLERHPATGLLASLAEVLPRLHPVNIEERGVSRAERLPQRAEDPLRTVIQRLTTLFGIEDHFEIFVTRAGITQVEIEPTFPASLLVPMALTVSAPRQELVLQLARALGRLRAGSYLAGRLSARELGIVLAASLRSRYADYGRGLASEEVLDELAQKVARQLPRRHRRAFERGVVGVAEAGPLDVNRWRLAMSYTAQRAAVVGSGDVLGCLDSIISSERRLTLAATASPGELLDAARTFPEFTELVAFVLGDDYVQLRRIPEG